jgi:diguanylate cyclase (GGDEF)-like protein/PAS domain S-box-containing protein
MNTDSIVQRLLELQKALDQLHFQENRSDTDDEATFKLLFKHPGKRLAASRKTKPGNKTDFSNGIKIETVYPWEEATLLLEETRLHLSALQDRLETQAPEQDLHRTYQQAEEINSIVMAMSEAVTIYDRQGQIIQANAAAVHLFGLDPVGMEKHELLARLSIRNTDGSPIEFSDSPIEKASQGQRIIQQPHIISDHGSQEHIVLVTAIPLLHEQVVTAIVTVWKDISERETLLEQIEFEQSRLETILNHAPEAILITDEEARLTIKNMAAEKIFERTIPLGITLGELDQVQFCYMDQTPYNPRNLPLTCSALDGDRLYNVEVVTIFPGEEVRHLMHSTAPIIDHRGNIIGAIGIFQDITEQKKVEELLREQARRSQLTATLSKNFAEAGLHYRELLNTITHQIGQMFGDFCILFLNDEENLWYTPVSIFIKDPHSQHFWKNVIQEVKFQSEDAISYHIFETGQPVIFNRLTLEQAQRMLPPHLHPLLQELNVKMIHALALSLRAHSHWIGALFILRLKPEDPFEPGDDPFFQDLADRTALAVEDMRLYEREVQRARELQALHKAANTLLSTLDLETLLIKILETAQEALPSVTHSILYLRRNLSDLPPTIDEIELRALNGKPASAALQNVLIQEVEQAIQKKNPILVDRLVSSDRSASGALLEYSAIISPLISPRSTSDTQPALGALVLLNDIPKPFNEADFHLLASFAATASAAIQNALLYAEVQRLATIDNVTKQYNRNKFFELGELEMYRFRRTDQPLAAIMLDLDNFKEVNDQFGHTIGDQVLFTVAERCRESIRMFDILGRYGGDEFAILLPGASIDEAMEIAERIRQTILNTEISTSQGMVHVSISLGIAQATEKTTSLPVLLNRADHALYLAKGNGRNRVVRDEG